MAIIYQAQLTPSKIDLLTSWVQIQPWLGDANASTLEAVGAYRFDDPDGAVGLETHLLRTADGQMLQVPVTYRDAPVAGAELSLIATTQHSVLGKRWVYDACGDLVWVKALMTAVLTGGTQAELEVVTDTGPERREATTRVSGSGSSDSTVPPVLEPVTYSSAGTTTVVKTDHVHLILLRVVDPYQWDGTPGATPHLTGTWPAHDVPTLLAVAHTT
ncbi:MAG: hypothetical protein M3137_01890 [Actinomycetota bacterium]|nr:hypothetical protein [Actinomycetota bacterium]